jgi:hypothetical protein
VVVAVSAVARQAGRRTNGEPGHRRSAYPLPSRFLPARVRAAGDTLVVETVGFRDDIWIDWDGSMITGAGTLRERIRRPQFGYLEIDVTVDDPKAYTRPWTVTVRQQFAADTELIDEVCAEGERFATQRKP